MTVLTPHSDYERLHPEEGEAEASYEQARQARHIQRHGTLDGYAAPREFPCPGFLKVVAENASHVEIECDVCRWTTTRRVERFASQTEEVSSW